AVPLRRVRRRGCHVCPGGASLSHLRGGSPPGRAGIRRRAAVARAPARADRRRRARNRVDTGLRAVRMKVYVVGGAVRDELLGLPVKDRDYVVVGATPEAMTEQGFRPVGKDFPVFLHPRTHEEYALARTERKSGRGYKGFTVYAAPDVTLEEDLMRRDLTINAMAMPVDNEQEPALIDPWGGARDLKERKLRHVSP